MSAEISRDETALIPTHRFLCCNESHSRQPVVTRLVECRGGIKVQRCDTTSNSTASKACQQLVKLLTCYATHALNSITLRHD
jgi:hypothetical protein